MDLAIVLAVIVGFVAREVLGRALGAWFARVGEGGYVPMECGFFREYQTEDGQRIRARYFPTSSATGSFTL